MLGDGSIYHPQRRSDLRVIFAAGPSRPGNGQTSQRRLAAVVRRICRVRACFVKTFLAPCLQQVAFEFLFGVLPPLPERLQLFSGQDFVMVTVSGAVGITPCPAAPCVTGAVRIHTGIVSYRTAAGTAIIPDTGMCHDCSGFR
jgi:hypothetical protein